MNTYILIDDLGRALGKIVTKRRLPHAMIEIGGRRYGVKDTSERATITPLSKTEWARDPNRDVWLDTLTRYDDDGYRLGE